MEMIPSVARRPDANRPRAAQRNARVRHRRSRESLRYPTGRSVHSLATGHAIPAAHDSDLVRRASRARMRRLGRNGASRRRRRTRTRCRLRKLPSSERTHPAVARRTIARGAGREASRLSRRKRATERSCRNWSGDIRTAQLDAVAAWFAAAAASSPVSVAGRRRATPGAAQRRTAAWDARAACRMAPPAEARAAGTGRGADASRLRTIRGRRRIAPDRRRRRRLRRRDGRALSATVGRRRGRRHAGRARRRRSCRARCRISCSAAAARWPTSPSATRRWRVAASTSCTTARRPSTRSAGACASRAAPSFPTTD